MIRPARAVHPAPSLAEVPPRECDPDRGGDDGNRAQEYEVVRHGGPVRAEADELPRGVRAIFSWSTTSARPANSPFIRR